MKPTKMPHTTMVLEAPRGWNEDRECGALPITRVDKVMFSYWRVSWRERLRILLGHPVRLGVFSGGHPPVSLDVKP